MNQALQLVQTSYIERIKMFLFAPYNITELSRSVWENLDLGRCAFGLYSQPRSRFHHTDLLLG